jgi:hypothetical protein
MASIDSPMDPRDAFAITLGRNAMIAMIARNVLSFSLNSMTTSFR